MIDDLQDTVPAGAEKSSAENWFLDLNDSESNFSKTTSDLKAKHEKELKASFGINSSPSLFFSFPYSILCPNTGILSPHFPLSFSYSSLLPSPLAPAPPYDFLLFKIGIYCDMCPSKFSYGFKIPTPYWNWKYAAVIYNLEHVVSRLVAPIDSPEVKVFLETIQAIPVISFDYASKKINLIFLPYSVIKEFNIGHSVQLLEEIKPKKSLT